MDSYVADMRVCTCVIICTRVPCCPHLEGFRIEWNERIGWLKWMWVVERCFERTELLMVSWLPYVSFQESLSHRKKKQNCSMIGLEVCKEGVSKYYSQGLLLFLVSSC